MNLKNDCLAVTPMPYDDVDYFAKFAHRMEETLLKKWAKNVALSHERMRAERDGLQIMFDDLDRKVRHGCTDANCSICDGDK